MNDQIMVPSEGPLDASIVLVGEAPAANEIFKGRPFVGDAGQWLNKFLSLAGLNRDELYITNISKVRAPNDKMSKMPPDELQAWTNDLINEINDLQNPKVLVPLGSYPLQALTDKKNVTSYRGSLLRPISSIKHDCVIIPTRHPSTMNYGGNYGLWPYIVADFCKISRIAEMKKFKFPEYKFITKPIFNEVMEILDFLETDPSEFYVIDVENPHYLLSAIGLAWDRVNAISIPFYNGDGSNYWSLEREVVIFRRLAEVLPKLELANQNVLYDWRVMAEHGIHLRPPTWDPMLMHHCLYSELKHSLDVIVSIYTEMEYYKKDEKEEKGSSLKRGKEREHWIYNCYDCVGAYWSIESLREELIEEDMLSVYMDLYAEIIWPIFKMNMRGVPVDVPRLGKVQESLKQLIRDYCENIEKETGFAQDIDHVLNLTGKSKPNKDKMNPNSWQQVAKLLYEDMGMTRYKNESTGKKTLEKLAYKYQTDVPKWIIDIKSARKELGLFSAENIVGGRVRCEYSPRATTGRFKSKKPFGKGGMNLQNVKHGEPRKFFIGFDRETQVGSEIIIKRDVLVGADQQQAEARLAGWFAQEPKMIALFDKGVSIHIQNALNVFKQEVHKEHPLYRIAKSLIFGGNYGVGPWKFAYIANIPLNEAKIHLENYHNTYPGIRKNFHEYVQREIRTKRMLYNPFGRRQVFFGRKDDTTYRAGYAFLPQSTSSDINKKALKHMDKHYTMILETHDGLVASVPEREVKNAIACFQEAYDIDFKIWDYNCNMPISIEVGPNWDEMVEVTL